MEVADDYQRQIDAAEAGAVPSEAEQSMSEKVKQADANSEPDETVKQPDTD